MYYSQIERSMDKTCHDYYGLSSSLCIYLVYFRMYNHNFYMGESNIPSVESSGVLSSNCISTFLHLFVYFVDSSSTTVDILLLLATYKSSTVMTSLYLSACIIFFSFFLTIELVFINIFLIIFFSAFVCIGNPMPTLYIHKFFEKHLNSNNYATHLKNISRGRMRHFKLFFYRDK